MANYGESKTKPYCPACRERLDPKYRDMMICPKCFCRLYSSFQRDYKRNKKPTERAICKECKNMTTVNIRHSREYNGMCTPCSERINKEKNHKNNANRWKQEKKTKPKRKIAKKRKIVKRTRKKTKPKRKIVKPKRKKRSFDRYTTFNEDDNKLAILCELIKIGLYGEKSNGRVRKTFCPICMKKYKLKDHPFNCPKCNAKLWSSKLRWDNCKLKPIKLLGHCKVCGEEKELQLGNRATSSNRGKCDECIAEWWKEKQHRGSQAQRLKYYTDQEYRAKVKEDEKIRVKKREQKFQETATEEEKQRRKEKRTEYARRYRQRKLMKQMDAELKRCLKELES